MYSPNRINLLSDQEIEEIYAIPEFNNGDINIAAMVEKLEKHLKQHFWKIT